MPSTRSHATRRRPLQLLAVAGVLLSAALAMAAEPASTDTLALRVSAPRVVAPGARIAIVATPVGVRTCRLSATGGSSRVDVWGATTVRWSWRVPTRARPGRHRVTISCGGAKRSVAVRVRVASRRGGKVRRLARLPIRVTVDRADVPSPPAPAVTPAATAATAPAPESTCTRPLFGVHSPPAPEGGTERLDTLEQLLKRRISIVLWYQHWADWGPEVRPDWIRSAASNGRLPLLTWEPWRPDAVEQPAFRLRRIASGAFDDYIRRWATELRALGLVYLRPMHEMNGDWYPWAGTVNGNSAADYQAAWVRMHDIFEQAGAHNVRWVWSPYAEDVPSHPENAFEHYYPGSKYVDVLALDGYNWGTGDPNLGGWQSFEDIFGAAYARIARLGPQPIWIAETASAPGGGDKAEWVADMFRTVRRMPRLEAIVWFDVDKERDWRLTSSPAVEAAFACAA